MASPAAFADQRSRLASLLKTPVSASGNPARLHSAGYPMSSLDDDAPPQDSGFTKRRSQIAALLQRPPSGHRAPGGLVRPQAPVDTQTPSSRGGSAAGHVAPSSWSRGSDGKWGAVPGLESWLDGEAESSGQDKDNPGHWEALVASGVSAIPWASARRMHYVYGGCGGVQIVELDGFRAVCLKPQRNFALAEFIADRIGELLEAPIARTRIIGPGDDESGQIAAMIREISMRQGEKRRGRGLQADVGVFGVLEYVPGHVLVGPRAHEVLTPPATEVLEDLGRLCALDVLINNMDRLPLPLWTCAGNLKNVMVRSTDQRIVGIDQGVRIITHPDGLQRYLCRVRGLAAMLEGNQGSRIDQGEDAIKARLDWKLDQDCGTKLSPESVSQLVAALRAGLRLVAELWESGALLQCLDEAEVAAKQLFDGPTSPAVTCRFVRRVASEIWSGMRGSPLPSACPAM